MIHRLLLPLPPSANRYWRKDRRGNLHVSTEGQAYKAAVARLVSVMPARVPVAVEVEVFRAMKRGDLDNRVKVMLDALKGLAFLDDDQALELHAHRFDDDDKFGWMSVVVSDIDRPERRNSTHAGWIAELSPETRRAFESARSRLRAVGTEEGNAARRKRAAKALRAKASPALFRRSP